MAFGSKVKILYINVQNIVIFTNIHQSHNCPKLQFSEKLESLL